MLWKTWVGRVALLLGCIGLSISCASAQNTSPAALPDNPSPQPAKARSFFQRFIQFYREDCHSTAPQAPPPPRRGLPSPLESPPFPNADWSYGGSPVLGEPDTNSYPLMTAWNGARSRTKVYGWVEPTVNFGTSTHRNYPETNDIYSNRLEMNQLIVYVERVPDSVQREHVDATANTPTTTCSSTMPRGTTSSQRPGIARRRRT